LLHTVAVRQATLVSDESALEACACSRLCAIQIDDLYIYLYLSVLLDDYAPSRPLPSSDHQLLSLPTDKKTVFASRAFNLTAPRKRNSTHFQHLLTTPQDSSFLGKHRHRPTATVRAYNFNFCFDIMARYKCRLLTTYLLTYLP